MLVDKLSQGRLVGRERLSSAWLRSASPQALGAASVADTRSSIWAGADICSGPRALQRDPRCRLMGSHTWRAALEPGAHAEDPLGCGTDLHDPGHLVISKVPVPHVRFMTLA